MRKSLATVLLAAFLATTMVAPTFAAKKLKIAGSTTVLPLAQVWLEAFAKDHPDVDVSVSGGGSGTGISMLLNGTCDIANASREAKKKEIDTARGRNKKLTATRLAKDGIAIVVHPSNSVKNLTKHQLAGIYKGMYTNWKQVGGEDEPITVMGRDSSSGTYGFFRQAILGKSDYIKDMLALPSNAAVVQGVSQSPGAIGYVGMAFAHEGADEKKVRIISLSRKTGEAGMIPTDETVRSGKYPLFRYLYAYTLGSPSELAADYLKFALSSKGQAMVTKAGYIPLK